MSFERFRQNCPWKAEGEASPSISESPSLSPSPLNAWLNSKVNAVSSSPSPAINPVSQTPEPDEESRTKYYCHATSLKNAQGWIRHNDAYPEIDRCCEKNCAIYLSLKILLGVV